MDNDNPHSIRFCAQATTEKARPAERAPKQLQRAALTLQCLLGALYVELPKLAPESAELFRKATSISSFPIPTNPHKLNNGQQRFASNHAHTPEK